MEISEAPSYDIQSPIYSPTDISLLIAGIAAAFATIVYSCKHIKKSDCCGVSCEQVVLDEPCDGEHELNPVVDDTASNSEIIKQLGQLTHKIEHNSEF
jgi:hypothetical protein